MADETVLTNINFNSFVSKKSILLNNYSDPDINFYNNDEIIKNINPLYYDPNSKKIANGMEDNYFSMLHINIISIQKNFESLKQLLYKIGIKFQIICLSETWCKDKNIENNSNFQLPNYKVIHQVRASNKEGGGLCIYIKNSILFKVKPNLSSTTTDYESLCIEIINKTSKNIVIHGLYRPPSGSIKVFENHIKKIIKNKSSMNKAVYFIGDINLNILDYENKIYIKNFFNTIFQNSYIPLINKPTRITKESSTSLDRIITNEFINENIRTGIFTTDVSDHFPIFILSQKCIYNAQNEREKIIKTRLLTDTSISHFYKLLSCVNWDTLKLNLNANKAFDIFLTEFLNLYNKAFPEVTKEVIGKKSLYRNFLPLNLKFNNKQIVNKSLVAETLNQFFVNIGPTLSSNIATTQSHFSSYLTSTNLNVMSNYKLTEKELLDAVSLLKPNKSLGFDDISSNVIIKSIKQITIPLLHIFNLSLKQGVFPDNLKIAKVIPVLKSGDPSDVTNYRPISILSCFSKILERVMYNRLYSFLNVNNILFHKQFGFKSGHSTDHAITHLVHDIFKGFDEDKYTLGVFIDLSKAFDTVNHQILLSKLKSYGFSKDMHLWNYDETGFNREKRDAKVITRRGAKRPLVLNRNNKKINYAVLNCVNADGLLLPPFAVYK
ncbi:uncharacterized protein LOC136081332 [Hydra vulgaris]|uniref:Uncharacterized protein LOC136081332 n=1 Tax=Hydra vulgaris TaxID=6087 RepID=A0ABM4BZN7_HYDVU